VISNYIGADDGRYQGSSIESQNLQRKNQTMIDFLTYFLVLEF
jgi:hypothetical protein